MDEGMNSPRCRCRPRRSAARRGRVAAAIAAAALVLAPGAPALGQGPTAATGASTLGGPRRGVAMDVSLGLGPFVVAGRWTPVRVTLSGADAAVGERLEISTAGPDGSTMSVVLPASTTPGQATTFEASICPGFGDAGVSVRLIGENGRVLARRLLVDAPRSTRPDEMQMPPMVAANEPLLLNLSRMSLARARAGWGAAAPERPGADAEIRTPEEIDLAALASANEVVGTAEALPLSWTGYDSVACVLVRASTLVKLPAERAEPLRRWVERGGRLVVLADDPGAAWMTMLATDGRRAPVEVLAPPPLAPVEVRRAMGETVDPPADAETPDAAGDAPPPVGDAPPPVGEDAEDATESAAALAQQPETGQETGQEAARAAPPTVRLGLRLTEAGERDGWTAAWPVASAAAGEGEGTREIDTDAATSGGARGTVLLARGPVGLGWASVVAVDPGSVDGNLGDAPLARQWAEVLRGVSSRAPAFPVWWGAAVMSGPFPPVAQEAMSLLLDEAADAPRMGAEPFIAVVIVAAGLALAVGPVDALVLKALRMRHRSWLTAIGWTLLASTAAAFVPGLLRDNRHRVGRAAVSQVVFARDGRALAHASSGVTATFAGRSDIFAAGTPTGGVWTHPVSVTGSNGDVSGRLGPRSALFQASLPGPAGVERTALPAPVAQREWTVRTVLDDGPMRAEGGLSLAARLEAGPTVAITGLPPLAEADAVLELAGRRYEVAQNLRVDAEGGLVIQAWADPDVRDQFVETNLKGPESTWADAVRIGYLPSVIDRARVDIAWTAAKRFPRADAREAAIEARLASGRFAVLTLRLARSTSPAAWDGSAAPQSDATLHTETLRLVLPLPAANADPQTDPGSVETTEGATR